MRVDEEKQTSNSEIKIFKDYFFRGECFSLVPQN